MSVNAATGGDGWSKWSIERYGDDMLITVHSNAEKGQGGEAKILLARTIRDSNGREAVSLAESTSSLYANRMAN